MNIFPYQLIWLFAGILCIGSLSLAIYLYYHVHVKKQKSKIVTFETIFIILLLSLSFFAGKATTGHLSMPFFGKTQGPFHHGPELPIFSAFKFLFTMDNFERIDEIAYDPALVGEQRLNSSARNITYHLEAKEVLAEVTDGTTYNYWTINGTVPGPFLRAKVGDMVTIYFHNNITSLHEHSIDFHAVTGPGGGAKVLRAEPGQTKALRFYAKHPGLYVYHCASAHSVAAHMTHSQYGLILIEPEEGLPKVDKEFYVMQGELYTMGKTGDKGLVGFDTQAMLDEIPTYFVFNGRVGGITGKMNASVGDTVRIYFGNGGVAKVSSLHLIGEIFDNVYHEAAIDDYIHHNVQTTTVPAGGATIVEFTFDYPGDYVLVDHSLARMEKGLWGVMHVDGEKNTTLYEEISS